MLGRFYCSPPLSSSPPTQLRKEKQPQNGRHIGASRERQYFLSTLVFRAGPAMNKLPFVGLNIFLIFYLCVVLCVGHRRFIPHGRAQPSPLLPCLRPFLLPPPLFLPTLPSSSSPTHTHPPLSFYFPSSACTVDTPPSLESDASFQSRPPPYSVDGNNIRSATIQQQQQQSFAVTSPSIEWKHQQQRLIPFKRPHLLSLGHFVLCFIPTAAPKNEENKRRRSHRQHENSSATHPHKSAKGGDYPSTFDY